MTVLDIIDHDKAEDRIAELRNQSIPYGFLILNQMPHIILKDYVIARDSDGQISWRIDTDCINSHFFMLLTTGNKKPIALSICLLHDYSKKVAEWLLTTTKDEEGRFNAKDAEFFIVDSEGNGIKVKVSLAPLSLSYHLLKTLPKSHLLDLKSEHCPFCNLPPPKLNGETLVK